MSMWTRRTLQRIDDLGDIEFLAAIVSAGLASVTALAFALLG
jgi:hypothetical protein